jgi:hypothetical protein
VVFGSKTFYFSKEKEKKKQKEKPVHNKRKITTENNQYHTQHVRLEDGLNNN